MAALLLSVSAVSVGNMERPPSIVRQHPLFTTGAGLLKNHLMTSRPVWLIAR
jgi:hypothetical protein